jgi:cytochrome c oxidase cbb3-type subunit 3
MKPFRLTPAYVWALIAVSAATAFGQQKLRLPSGSADIAGGKKLFEHHCALCHGPKGEGGRGPVLATPKLSRAPDDEALVKVLQDGIRGTEMPAALDTMSEKEVRQTAAYVRTLGKVQIQIKPVPGNPIQGAEIYRGKGGCALCHAINGDGGVSGPDLGSIGGRRSATYLREALLDPEAAVPEGYLLVAASLKDGSKVAGARMNEDSFSIQILDPAGRLHSFWKSELAELTKQFGKSPMPSFKGRLSEDELLNLIAYLTSLKEDK